ncbi:LysR family transcriptional regulator [Magnetospira sp. QH-2]|uniref:LysR family transcriptional regulator n=1 Tax=Magnetospira sp. (strain QH-2) TaxID=1288970 RepID=UPI0003E8174E|nr:LysR substrate-binding domain-containing protein [Magnetospira sp. QH-2]CCQ72546.1 putative Transcriptional regulator, LysR family [Magnetospira sp. QH-2]
MQSFDIVTLRVFLAIARAGSIGAAARNEHIAASAVSRRISDLEHDLGITLIRRTPAGATLTPAGQVFAGHCETSLNHFANVRAELKRYSEGKAGELRLAAVTSVMAGRLPKVLKVFQDTFPSVDVTLTEIYSADGIRQLREDLADLVVIADTSDTRGFDVRPYASDPVWVVGEKGHPLFEGRQSEAPIAFSETLDFEHLSLHEGGVLDELVANATRKAGRQPKRRIRVARFDALRSCVSAGLGLGFLRESSVKPYLELEGLVGAPLTDAWADRRLICVFPKAQDVSPVVGEFLSLL